MQIWPIGLFVALIVSVGNAQMVVVETPLDNVGSSFYERQGVGFSFAIPGSDTIVGIGPDGQPTSNGAIQFSWGGLDSALPPFGGHDPNADARFGFGYLGKDGGGFGLNFALGQGADRTYTQTRPIIVLQNGFPGSVTDTTQRPFVTSIVPVLGDQQLGPLPADEAERASAELDYPRQGRGARKNLPDGRVAGSRSSTATAGDLSVAEIRRQKREAKRSEIAKLLADARQAVAEGKHAMAKNYFKNAARRAAGDQRAKILAELEQATQASVSD